MKVSKHGKKRIQKRIRTKKITELMIKVNKEGKNIDSIRGSKRRYLDSIRTRYTPKTIYIKLYKNRIYLFGKTDHKFITVLQLPAKYIKKNKGA